MRQHDDLDHAMDHVRDLEVAQQRLMRGGDNGDRQRDAELAALRAELDELQPIRRAWIRRRFFC